MEMMDFQPPGGFFCLFSWFLSFNQKWGTLYYKETVDISAADFLHFPYFITWKVTHLNDLEMVF